MRKLRLRKKLWRFREAKNIKYIKKRASILSITDLCESFLKTHRVTKYPFNYLHVRMPIMQVLRRLFGENHFGEKNAKLETRNK